MSSLTYWNALIIKRIKLIDEFRDLYQDSDVFNEDMRIHFKAYFQAYNDYYAFKPFIKSYVDNPKTDIEMTPLVNKRTSAQGFFDEAEQNQTKLEELRMDVIRKGAKVNHLLDEVGFKIVQYLGGMERLHTAQNDDPEAIVVSHGLGEKLLVYLSAMAQKAWLKVAVPTYADDYEGQRDDKPLFIFSKTKMNLAPKEDEEQSQQFNNNNGGN